ncbi:hypothetical protein HAX54_016052 [Datura stramonium]|uniref:Uncharacterized protein n=1 Tax=Datura stramonium TaxID=4076 RepID=A0ABS8UJZ2_DATST|nr:hypothetical protein [Datura stramonium]
MGPICTLVDCDRWPGWPKCYNYRCYIAGFRINQVSGVIQDLPQFWGVIIGAIEEIKVIGVIKEIKKANLETGGESLDMEDMEVEPKQALLKIIYVNCNHSGGSIKGKIDV